MGLHRHRCVTLLTAAVVLLATAFLARAAEDEGEAARQRWKLQETRSAEFTQHLLTGEFEAAAAMFDATMREVLPAEKLRDAWKKIAAEYGPFDDDLDHDTDRYGDETLQIITFEGGPKGRIAVRLAMNDRAEVTGMWIDRADEDEPAGFRAGGYRFGPVIERVAAAGLELEVRVFGINGQPVNRSSVSVFREIGAEASREPWDWLDAEGKTWRGMGGAATGATFTCRRLAPGWYRAAVREGHGNGTPVGVSETVLLDGSRKQTSIDVRMMSGGTVVFRAVKAGGDEAPPRPSVRLTRQDQAFPPGWDFSPINARDESAPFRIENLPAGTYRIEASRRAYHPDELEYGLAEGPIELKVTAGSEQVVDLPMKGQPLSSEEIERRWPWMAFGTVTDGEGRPLEGVEISAHCGMGTLMPTGHAVSAADGSYTLRFAPGMHFFSEEEGRIPANQQAATIAAHRPGWSEKNLNRHGGLTMANRLPDEDENVWNAKPDEILLPQQPRRLDFVMLPAADIELFLADSEDKPIGDQYVYINGAAMPPSSNVVESGKTDAAGRLEMKALPADYPWRVVVPREGSWEGAKTLPFTLPRADRYQLRLRQASADGVELIEIVSLLDAQGKELRDEAVGDDPLARPPLPPEEQAKGREILRKLGELNSRWLEPGAPGVGSYCYSFRLGDREPQAVEIQAGQRSSLTMRQGVSYHSVVHWLAANPEKAVFRQLERDEKKITLTYTLAEPVRVAAGNGIAGTWRGYFSRSVREGTLVVNAATFTPMEHTSGELREMYSQFVEIAPNRPVPLAITIDQGGMHFDWRFRVYQPGLWLFHEARYGGGAGKAAAVVAKIEQVEIDGRPAELSAAAEP